MKKFVPLLVFLSLGPQAAQYHCSARCYHYQAGNHDSFVDYGNLEEYGYSRAQAFYRLQRLCRTHTGGDYRADYSMLGKALVIVHTSWQSINYARYTGVVYLPYRSWPYSYHYYNDRYDENWSMKIEPIEADEACRPLDGRDYFDYWNMRG